MAGVCKVILIGNLGRDPETRYTPSGAMNVQFTMAVSRRFTDQTLDSLTQSGYLTKGKQVFVLGTLEAREYQDQQGQTRTSLDVRAEEIQLLGSRGDTAPAAGVVPGAGVGKPGEVESLEGTDFDDVPF